MNASLLKYISTLLHTIGIYEISKNQEIRSVVILEGWQQLSVLFVSSYQIKILNLTLNSYINILLYINL